MRSCWSAGGRTQLPDRPLSPYSGAWRSSSVTVANTRILITFRNKLTSLQYDKIFFCESLTNYFADICIIYFVQLLSSWLLLTVEVEVFFLMLYL